MNCEESRELFLDYLGNELDKPSARELSSHLRACPSCKQEFALLSGVRATLRTGWPDEEIPQHLSFDLPKALSPGLSGWLARWGLSRAMASGLVATACFVLCVASLALFRTQVEVSNGAFRISFGSSQPSVAPAIDSLPSSPAGPGREEIQTVIQKAVQRFQETQSEALQQELQRLRGEIEAKRSNDMKQVARGLKYLEETQSLVWREAARNSTYLDTIARDLYVKTASPQ